VRRLAPALLGPRPAGATIAVAGFAGLASLGLAAALSLDGERAALENRGRQVTVAVAGGDPTPAAAIVAMLRGRDDLRDVRAVSPAALRAELGAAAPDALPALVDARLVAGASEAPLVHALAGVPGVSVTRAAVPSTDAIGRLIDVAGGVAAAGMVGGAAMGAVIARGLLGGVALLERLGASDRQIAGLVVRGAARSIAIGGVVGMLAVIPFLFWQDGALPRWAWIALVPPAIVVAGSFVAAVAAALLLRRRT
jgi:hypothetical protein